MTDVTGQAPLPAYPRRSEPGALSVQVVEDEAAFSALEVEWNVLHEKAGARNPFLSWDWMYLWWRHFEEGRKLHILIVRRAGEAVAIAPFCVRPPQPARLIPWSVIEFLGSGVIGSDYLDLIVAPGQEASAIPRLALALRHGAMPLELRQVWSGSQNMQRLVSCLERTGWRSSRMPLQPAPFLELPGDFEEYLSSLGRSHRANVRRRIRKLKQAFDVSFEPVVDQQERPAALERLIELHMGRWSDRGGSDAFHTRESREFHEDFTREALDHGWLRLLLLKLDGEVVAALYGIRLDDTFYFYQSGFDPEYSDYSVGLVLMGLSIEYAIAEGAREFDFLHGDEGYKYLWTQTERELLQVDVFPHRVWQQSSNLARQLKKGVRSLQGTASELVDRGRQALGPGNG